MEIAFILGCCLGSFSECMALRMLSGESIVVGRSHCDSCGHQLRAWELIPIASWIFLRGRCRYCKTQIPLETVIVELISGIACCLIVNRYGMSVMSLRSMLLWIVLLTASLTDLHEWIIPDRLQIAGVLIFVGTACFLPNPVEHILHGTLIGMLMAGGLLLLTFIMDRIMGRESLGGGDIKLFFVTSLYLGSVWEILFYLILSSVFGLVLAAMRKQSHLPFGPAITVACFVMMLYGSSITQWYLSLF